MRFLPLLFCLFSYFVFGQKSALSRAEPIPEEVNSREYLRKIIHSNAIELDRLWSYCGQEDTTNADWKTINTVTLNDLTGQSYPWSGKGWFKKSFIVPVALRNQPLYFQMVHWGASEIFLDGVKLASYGKIGNSRSTEHTFLPDECISFLPDNRLVHHLEVHYSNHHINLPGAPSIFHGFKLSVSEQPILYREKIIDYSLGVMSISFCLGFSLFFFFVFWFYPQRLASLMAAIWLLHFSFIFIPLFLIGLNTDGEFSRFCILTWQIAVATINSSVVLFYYALYYDKLPRRSWFVVGISALIVLAIFIFPLVGKYVLLISLLLLFEVFRMLILGYQKDRNKFWILAIGQPLSLFLFLLAIVNIFGIFPEENITTGRFISIALSDLCVPIMLALQLAWEFGSANRVLQKQVVQVKELLEENMIKEHEKQELLAAQNETLELQVTERTAELNQSLETLKATQAQLIQSEKLASLGELTAGIAHEIQNPLNFVNNFAEISEELLVEMEAEFDKGDTTEAKAIATDIKQNLQKINHHGKRASSIVKGMLDHSRTSSGKKEPTDINALADEFLRLAYHGFRAKDSDFNVTLQTNFDPKLPKIEIVSQDIGRVVLNLINNAFYAVGQKTKNRPGTNDDGTYVPTVEVSTRGTAAGIEIKVADNGSGIPEALITKVFQPFFTTKPTGEGTGLGLSLSRDIIVNGHGGTLSITSTTEGKETGTTFTIFLPIINPST